jgi:hypothetical protein
MVEAHWQAVTVAAYGSLTTLTPALFVPYEPGAGSRLLDKSNHVWSVMVWSVMAVTLLEVLITAAATYVTDADHGHVEAAT